MGPSVNNDEYHAGLWLGGPDICVQLKIRVQLKIMMNIMQDCSQAAKIFLRPRYFRAIEIMMNIMQGCSRAAQRLLFSPSRPSYHHRADMPTHFRIILIISMAIISMTILFYHITREGTYRGIFISFFSIRIIIMMTVIAVISIRKYLVF